MKKEKRLLKHLLQTMSCLFELTIRQPETPRLMVKVDLTEPMTLFQDRHPLSAAILFRPLNTDQGDCAITEDTSRIDAMMRRYQQK